jgi:signal transduction histidine kinase
MAQNRISRPSMLKSLSARLLVLTVFFVMLSEVMIYVPSIARFRLVYLEERLAAAHLAIQALQETPDQMISAELERELLTQVGARAVILKRQESRHLMLSEEMPPNVDAMFDLHDKAPARLIRDAFELLRLGPRVIRVVGPAPTRPELTVEVLLDEDPMRAAMIDYSRRILALSIVISLITATLVYLSLQLLMVRPMRRITESLMAFHTAPEDASRDVAPSRRSDEIGIAQRELAHMQADLRAALKQKDRLAALGTAVSKINHDLRNILATAQIVSDRLSTSADPEVRHVTPTLIDSIDRAISLCGRTLDFGSADEPPPQRLPFTVSDLLDDVGATVGLPADDRIVWRNEVASDLRVEADREQMFRVFLNLGRNSIQAMGGRGRIQITAERAPGKVTIDFADTGPGLTEKAQAHLFEAFAGTSRSGGSGLGLAIARDLMRAHGGDIRLLSSGPEGTTFRLELPD